MGGDIAPKPAPPGSSAAPEQTSGPMHAPEPPITAPIPGVARAAFPAPRDRGKPAQLTPAWLDQSRLALAVLQRRVELNERTSPLRSRCESPLAFSSSEAESAEGTPPQQRQTLAARPAVRGARSQSDAPRYVPPPMHRRWSSRSSSLPSETLLKQHQRDRVALELRRETELPTWESRHLWSNDLQVAQAVLARRLDLRARDSPLSSRASSGMSSPMLVAAAPALPHAPFSLGKEAGPPLGRAHAAPGSSSTHEGLPAALLHPQGGTPTSQLLPWHASLRSLSSTLNSSVCSSRCESPPPGGAPPGPTGGVWGGGSSPQGGGSSPSCTSPQGMSCRDSRCTDSRGGSLGGSGKGSPRPGSPDSAGHSPLPPSRHTLLQSARAASNVAGGKAAGCEPLASGALPAVWRSPLHSGTKDSEHASASSAPIVTSGASCHPAASAAAASLTTPVAPVARGPHTRLHARSLSSDVALSVARRRASCSDALPRVAAARRLRNRSSSLPGGSLVKDSQRERVLEAHRREGELPQWESRHLWRADLQTAQAVLARRLRISGRNSPLVLSDSNTTTPERRDSLTNGTVKVAVPSPADVD